MVCNTIVPTTHNSPGKRELEPLANPGQQGSTLVEVALLIGPFLLFILIVVQLAFHGYTLITLQHFLTRAARQGSLTTGTAAAQRVAELVDTARQEGKIAVDMRDVRFQVCPLLNPGCAVNEPGGGNQYLLVTASKSTSLFLGVGKITLTCRAIARNEPV